MFSGGRREIRTPEILAQRQEIDVSFRGAHRQTSTQTDSYHAWTSGPGAFRYCVVIALADQ